jgi:hypothetical protein
MAEENEDQMPEGLEEFVQKIFGDKENAEQFTESMEANQMVEAWQGIYEVYSGLKSGGFTTSQANGVMGAYLFHLISALEGGL